MLIIYNENTGLNLNASALICYSFSLSFNLKDRDFQLKSKVLLT